MICIFNVIHSKFTHAHEKTDVYDHFIFSFGNKALMGASIAALTIYDMVKAVSHRVEIGKTVLVSKSGGKSDFFQK